MSFLERIRLSSIEPTDVTDELIDMMAVNDKLCPHLHIPLQSLELEETLRKSHEYLIGEMVNDKKRGVS